MSKKLKNNARQRIRIESTSTMYIVKWRFRWKKKSLQNRSRKKCKNNPTPPSYFTSKLPPPPILEQQKNTI